MHFSVHQENNVCFAVWCPTLSSRPSFPWLNTCDTSHPFGWCTNWQNWAQCPLVISQGLSTSTPNRNKHWWVHNTGTPVILKDLTDHIVKELRQWLLPCTGSVLDDRQGSALGGGNNMLGILYQAPSLNSNGSTTHAFGAESPKYKEHTVRQVQSYRNLGKFRNGQKSNSREGGISHLPTSALQWLPQQLKELKTRTCFQRSKTPQLYH